MDAPTDVSVTEEVAAEGIPGPRAWVSALNWRRWQTFKANRRGFWSLWIFLVLFGISLCAEFIANDKPILVEYDGQLYWPIFEAYPETDFGGIFETEADYRDPVVQELITEKGGWMLWPPIRFSYNTQNKNPPMAFPVKPTWLLTDKDCELAAEKGFHRCNASLEWNWLGTDDQGRDVVARIIYGFRISVLFGLVLTIFSTIIGVSAGAIQGYFGGWVDLVYEDQGEPFRLHALRRDLDRVEHVHAALDQVVQDVTDRAAAVQVDLHRGDLVPPAKEPPVVRLVDLTP